MICTIVVILFGLILLGCIILMCVRRNSSIEIKETEGGEDEEKEIGKDNDLTAMREVELIDPDKLKWHIGKSADKETGAAMVFEALPCDSIR